MKVEKLRTMIFSLWNKIYYKYMTQIHFHVLLSEKEANTLPVTVLWQSQMHVSIQLW